MNPEWQSWLAFADTDFRRAQGDIDEFPRGACFDFQQASEKYLKAVLLKRGLESPPIHNLRDLLMQIDRSLLSHSREIQAARLLNLAISRGCYPSETDEPSPEEATAMGEAAIVLRQFAYAALGVGN
jgi:HEPN domain-containing protein